MSASLRCALALTASNRSPSRCRRCHPPRISHRRSGRRSARPCGPRSRCPACLRPRSAASPPHRRRACLVSAHGRCWAAIGRRGARAAARPSPVLAECTLKFPRTGCAIWVGGAAGRPMDQSGLPIARYVWSCEAGGGRFKLAPAPLLPGCTRALGEEERSTPALSAPTE